MRHLEVVAIVGEVAPDGTLRSSAGIARLARPEEGVVVNIESTVQSIQRAVEKPS